MTIRIDCVWTDEGDAAGYLVTSPDVPGLVAGGETAAEVERKLEWMLPALLERDVARSEWEMRVVNPTASAAP